MNDRILKVCNEQLTENGVFFLSVSIMDRFLSKVAIDKSYLQLLAVACMFIASKLTEVVPLDAQKLVTYTESSVTIQEIQVLISIHNDLLVIWYNFRVCL